jgi:hypothetical protein
LRRPDNAGAIDGQGQPWLLLRPFCFHVCCRSSVLGFGTDR